MSALVQFENKKSCKKTHATNEKNQKKIFLPVFCAMQYDTWTFALWLQRSIWRHMKSNSKDPFSSWYKSGINLHELGCMVELKCALKSIESKYFMWGKPRCSPYEPREQSHATVHSSWHSSRPGTASVQAEIQHIVCSLAYASNKCSQNHWF